MSATVKIDRPLNDDERELLVTLAVHVLADRSGCTDQEAADDLHRLAAARRLVFEGDCQHVGVRVVGGDVLVVCARDWLCFHASYPGCDPLKDETVVW